jgi:hypothetical protein
MASSFYCSDGEGVDGMSTLYKSLSVVRGLIANKESWCQHEPIIREKGKPTKRCLRGAIFAASLNESDEKSVVESLVAVIGGGNGSSVQNLNRIARYNDTHSHDDVIALIDTAQFISPVGTA